MKILVIRRDNIGDLVCTTPLLACLAEKLPDARVDVLVNDYNCDALAGNPHVRYIWVYRKAKHRKAGESRFAVWSQSFRLMMNIRRQKYDFAIIASPGFQPSALRLARLSGARSILGYAHPGTDITSGLPAETAALGHEVEATMRLAGLLGLDTSRIPSLQIVPDPVLQASYRESLPPGCKPMVALHISARKPSQRWPVERFAALANHLCTEHDSRVLLFWAPGAEDDPTHPGDDAKAKQMMYLCADLPVFPIKTTNLRELVAALSLANSYVGADGGAMHLAAGLGLPIVALFGQSDCQRWRPWVEPAICLQPISQDVADISLQDVLSAWVSLTDKR